MRTKITVCVALLLLGTIVTAWATASLLPVLPAQKIDAPVLLEPQQNPVPLPVPSRGQMLYENHCMACHESVVFIRDKRRIQTPEALRGKVLHWASYLQLHWSKEEVEEVVSHLNSQYYKFEGR